MRCGQKQLLSLSTAQDVLDVALEGRNFFVEEVGSSGDSRQELGDRVDMRRVAVGGGVSGDFDVGKEPWAQ